MAGFFDQNFQHTIDYVLIVCLLIITAYYMYHIIVSGRQNKPQAAEPPFQDTPSTAQRAQLSKLENNRLSSGVINASFNATKDNALRHYCIKSASNCAYTDGYMNMNMVKHVLSRGCRFLDMEVYMKEGVPIVAYSTNKQSLETFTSRGPALSLQGVFSTIMSNAFSETSPNPHDPLFLHLRIKTYDGTAYTKIAKLIKSQLGNKLYVDGQGNAVPVTLDTQVPNLSGKVVVIVDQHASPGYDNYATCSPENTDCYSLAKMTNMTSNSHQIRTYQQKDLTFQPINPPDPAVYLFRIVFPDIGYFENTYNADSLYLMKNYGVQAVAQAFFVNDANLRSYEEIFRNKKSAFIRLESVLHEYE